MGELHSGAMHRRGTASRIVRRIASALACLGLLGHGLAMLTVSLLAAVPSGSPPGVPLVAEICTPDGVAQLRLPVDLEEGGGTTPDPQRPAAPIDGCPVCTAFAQAGCGDLPVVGRVSYPAVRVAVPQPALRGRIATAFLLTPQSRAPPLAT